MDYGRQKHFSATSGCSFSRIIYPYYVSGRLFVRQRKTAAFTPVQPKVETQDFASHKGEYAFIASGVIVGYIAMGCL